MMKAIFPGSFDPPTKGHVDLIRRSAYLCDRLVVGVLINPDKRSLFTPEQRVDMLERCTADYNNVEVHAFTGLLVDFARQQGARLILRGVRGAADLENESAMAWANAQLLPGLETLLIPASAKYTGISSSLIRQIAQMGGDISSFVPEALIDEIQSTFYNSK
jgi:pantetheine-phosphate adenylyltransferase